MDQSAQYKRFHDSQTDGMGPPVTDNTVTSPPDFEIDKRMAQNVRRSKILAIIQLVSSCLILLCGTISTGLIVNFFWGPYTDLCSKGTSIWTPVLGIITGGLGLGALQSGTYNRKCLLVAHFVMCIISAVASTILIGFTSFCLSDPFLLRHTMSYDECRKHENFWCIPDGLAELLVSTEALIVICALAHMITSIVSSAFICRYWCDGKGTNSSAGTVVYVPRNMQTGAASSMQAITIPAGAQVVFIPTYQPAPESKASAPTAP